ncbi:Rrf2 family transcriptional regulator [Apibacter muscae]|uniref:Rrf2 family transcriptional regulator n=1 Tax=Apibacter muscae TaxID=2509004 RepID=A0A563D8Y3_9FLAO|nr:Rrf2 family transcriptional regulator [Apibacter muscae]TWP22812.1 Rrf2 family transcriptional regulator [Apibacter muscae]TWP26577.1 Rrf2 family transcriptional regulator [Apibacter muscae]TWP28151.1 Rrf2 family transcriptional regulator [Apibacter muscae]
MFSKSCEYAIRSCLFIAIKSSNNYKVGIREISNEINSPIAFTAKILQKLGKNHLIKSLKGPKGGFYLEGKDLENIKLSHVVSAIDGESVYKGCALGLPKCSETQPCPVHFKFKSIREELSKMLLSTSLKDLIDGLDRGETFLKIK